MLAASPNSGKEYSMFFFWCLLVEELLPSFPTSFRSRASFFIQLHPMYEMIHDGPLGLLWVRVAPYTT
jgi:hypothetical protein